VEAVRVGAAPRRTAAPTAVTPMTIIIQALASGTAKIWLGPMVEPLVSN